MRFTFLALGLALALPARASELGTALEAAFARSPEASAAQAASAEFGARAERAERWTAGAPALAGSYKSDQWQDDRGLRETELGVSVPLWLPGERAASRAFAEDGRRRSETELAALRLALAGELRSALWTLEAARAEAELAEQRLALAKTLAEDIARQVQAGEKAESDRLLVLSERLGAERTLAEARLAAQVAETAWRRMTGLPPVIASVETRATAPEPEAHPVLRALAAARVETKAELELARASGRESPSLGVAATRERAERNLPNESSLTLSFSLPLGEHAEQGEREARLNTRLAELDARYVQTRDSLALERTAAESALEQAERVTALAAEARTLAVANREHARRALSLGELSLIDFNRIDALAFEAERGARLAETALGLAVARLNQVFGVLP